MAETAKMSLKYQIVPVTPFEQNCSLVWCSETQRAAVIDPGGDVSRIVNAAAKLSLTIEKVLLTHGHIDHAGGAAELAQRLSVPIEGPHRADQFWIDGLPQQSRMFGFPPVQAFVPDRWLEHGDHVTVGNREMSVLHCPGHTPGHIVFHDAGGKLAFVGDVLFKGSVGRTDFPQGDFDALISSIRERLWPLGDDVTFVPGHGPTSTFGTERRTNPFCGD
ncbi:MBL fold metallo-hydrolase [Propionivibrio soli]|uniref:MBL fold metallo-hydrolase n=1 Tax=Propionivibrio soli TaxID=2976531 RepID=UPI0021E837ED|nr:MBL fold metallo-hydrolase [Propionivibrio soli]